VQCDALHLSLCFLKSPGIVPLRKDSTYHEGNENVNRRRDRRVNTEDVSIYSDILTQRHDLFGGKGRISGRTH